MASPRHAMADHEYDKPSNAIAKRLGQFHFNAPPNARRLRIGRISAQDEFAGLTDESAGNLGWTFFERLRESGRGAVDIWLDESAPRASRRAAA